MPSYYEILNLSPQCSTQEIEATIDAQYNRWRKLVTHHDPNIATEATRSLNTLEQIRGVLTDQSKRAEYDQSLKIGGLADPEALLRSVAPPPAPSQPEIKPSSSSQAERRVDAWICQHCDTANAVGMKHCANCGSIIGQPCPQCEETTAVVDKFCSHCGANIVEVRRKKQVEAQTKQINELRYRIANLQQEITDLEIIGNKILFTGNHANEVGAEFGCGLFLFLIGLAGAIILFFGSLFSSPSAGTLWFLFFLLSFIFWQSTLRFRVSKKVREKVESAKTEIASAEQQVRQIQATPIE